MLYLYTSSNNSKRASHKYTFESLRDFATWLDNAPRTWRLSSSTLLDAEHSKHSWALGCDYPQAVKYAANGWLEGAQRPQRALARIAPRQPAKRLRNDYSGFRPHVPRYCAGAPNCMVSKGNTSGSKPVLHIYVSISTSWRTDAECMANYCIAIAQYVRQLELAGTRCAVYMVSALLYHYARQSFQINVKGADQPLDLSVLAFAIGHPAMLRRLIFAAIERGEAKEQMGYGTPMDVVHSDLTGAPSNVAILNGMKNVNSTSTTPEKAIEAVSREIERNRDNV